MSIYKKERVVVICPGRGSYTKETLHYFKQFSHRPELVTFREQIDQKRIHDGYMSVTEMDQQKNFVSSLHTPGENASTLIYACALSDFQCIDQDRFEIAAVVGNSMGWYLALSCAGALDENGSYQVVQTMGSMMKMKEKIIGGQIIYPVINNDWTRNKESETLVYKIMDQINTLPDHKVYVSIFLGGYLVLAGNEKGLSQLLKELPPIEHYPFKLINHAAFHTPLLNEISQRGFELIPKGIFHQPKIPLIDGRGKIWMPHSTSLEELYQYTLGHQVVAPYDFTTELTVALKEFAPDKLILLGPGNTLGGAIGQILIQNRWQKITSKLDFTSRQKQNPYLISMGIPEQRQLVI